MKYAKLNENKQIVEYVYFDELPPHKAGYLLPVEYDEKPQFDPATHYIIEGFPVVEENRVKIGWILCEFTQDEIAIRNRKICTPLQLWNAIGLEKQSAIFFASESDPNIKMFLYMLGMATQVESNHPQTQAGFQYLISKNIFTQQEVDDLFLTFG